MRLFDLFDSKVISFGRGNPSSLKTRRRDEKSSAVVFLCDVVMGVYVLEEMFCLGWTMNGIVLTRRHLC
jgi:hypothetical protein